MKVQQTLSDAESNSDWQKTPFANLIRYLPSGTYFARVRVKGKLIRRSLKTKTLSVAKLRLADLEKSERKKIKSSTAVLQGKMTFGDALAAYKQQRKNDPNLKSGTIEYDDYRIKALLESWTDLEGLDVSKISDADCRQWGEKNAKKVSSSSHNHTVAILRNVFKVAIEAGARYDNPALAAKRVKESRKKQIKLPEGNQLEMVVNEIKKSGNRRYANVSANLVEFLAYGGFRKSEAKYITWADCDFKRGQITVKGSPTTGLKRRAVGESRVVPMIADMRGLLERIKAKRPNARPNDRIMFVTDCKKSINAACKELEITRFTHHDLRHLFATRCIEAGVDVPTVARWLGHKDGGALAMKVYGHLRDEHSAKMAQKVVFSDSAPKIVSLTDSVPMKSAKAVPQAKAKYSYPWWASNNPLEIFWGQINEPVQIVPTAKYLEAAKAAMEREFFEQELSEPQILIEEFEVRVGDSVIEKLKAKISMSPKQKAA